MNGLDFQIGISFGVDGFFSQFFHCDIKQDILGDKYCLLIWTLRNVNENGQRGQNIGSHFFGHGSDLYIFSVG